MVSFYAFPDIFIDTVYVFNIYFFQKKAPWIHLHCFMPSLVNFPPVDGRIVEQNCYPKGSLTTDRTVGFKPISIWCKGVSLCTVQSNSEYSKLYVRLQQVDSLRRDCDEHGKCRRAVNIGVCRLEPYELCSSKHRQRITAKVDFVVFYLSFIDNAIPFRQLYAGSVGLRVFTLPQEGCAQSTVNCDECLCICLSARISQKNYKAEFRRIFCACWLWS